MRVAASPARWDPQSEPMMEILKMNANISFRGDSIRTMVAAGALALVGIATPAHADILGSGPAYGGPTQSVAVCYVYNPSNVNVTISSIRIVTEPFGSALPVVSNNCTPSSGAGLLAPGRTCRTVSNLGNNVIACRVDLSSQANARASMEIRNSGSYILNTREVR